MKVTLGLREVTWGLREVTWGLREVIWSLWEGGFKDVTWVTGKLSLGSGMLSGGSGR